MVITILMKVLARGRASWGNSLLSSARIPNSVQAAASTAVGVGCTTSMASPLAEVWPLIQSDGGRAGF
jgi:hypothetical protein